MQTTYFSDLNQFLTKNVPYWDRFGRYIVIFTFVILGKTLARYLVRVIKSDRKVNAVKDGEKKKD